MIIYYIKRIYANYNPSILIHLYRNYCKNYQDKKNFFLYFIKCVREKENKEKMPLYLFLLKNEDMPDYYVMNHKFYQYNDGMKEEKYNLYFYQCIYKFISKYLVELKYSKYCFCNFYISKILDEIEKSENEKNEMDESKEFKEYSQEDIDKRIIFSYLGFHYSSNNDKNIYNKILDRFISFKISIYDFMRTDYILNEKNNIRKIIKNIEELSNNTMEKSLEIEKIHDYNFNSWKDRYISEVSPFQYQYFKGIGFCYGKKKIVLNKINNNSLFNLYIFLKALKKEKKDLINVINSNFIFLVYIIDLFNSIFITFDYLSKTYDFPNYNFKYNKDKVLFIFYEIYEFYVSFFTTNINNNIYLKIIERYKQNSKRDYKTIYHLNNIFYKRIINLKNKKDIIKEYEIFKKILINFFSFSEEIEEYDIIKEDKNYFYKGSFSYYLLDNYKSTLSLLFQKDSETFYDFIKFIIINCSSQYKDRENLDIDIYKLILLLMNKNIDEFMKIYPKLLTLISSEKEAKENTNNKIKYLKIRLIKNIFNNSKPNILVKYNILKESKLFTNLTSSLYILNDIKNKEVSIFAMNKIKELLSVNNNVELFLESIKIPISNKFIFDILLNSIEEEEEKELNENNKKIIIQSLFKYSEINGYYFIQRIIDFISKYISLEEIKDLILYSLNIEEGASNNNINYLEISEENEENRNNQKNNKYLLFYALSERIVKNYETIAILFEYCTKSIAILALFPFLKDNLDEIFNFKIMEYLSYFSVNKNKEKIKELGKNFYDLLLFFESFLSKSKIINSFENIKKKYFTIMYK